MGLLNGLAAAGGSLSDLGRDWGRSLLEQDKIKLADQLASAREATGDYRRADLLKDAEGRAEQRQIAEEGRRPGVAAAVATATADATAQATIRNAPGLLNVETTRAKELAAIEIQRQVDAFEKLAPLRRQEAIDTELGKLKALSTPEALKATRAIAQAGHIVDPQYSLVPQADGTVTAVNLRNPSDSRVVKDADGKPIVRKDSEEMKAAVSVINLANTELKIAEAAYKVDSQSMEPGAKEKAEVVWRDAQRRAREIAAPAYAVLFDKAKIPGVKNDAGEPAGKTGWDPASGDVFKDGKKIGTAKSAVEANTMVHRPTAAPVATKPQSAELPAGAPDPAVAARERRVAAQRAAREAEQEQLRQQRIAARRQDEVTAGLINRSNRGN